MTQVVIVPLGGVAEIGKNCTAVIQGDDMVLVDCGISFPTNEEPGVDVVIPDFKFIEENQDKLRGVLITHAHEDHIGALPYFLKRFNVPVFATEFTHAMIRRKVDEKLDVRELHLVTVKMGDVIDLGQLKAEFIRVTHSIPETSAISIHTTHGHVLFTGDFKFDLTPVDGKFTDYKRLTELGEEGVVCLLSDSTNVDRPGWGPSESSVTSGLRRTMAAAEGRILVTMFSSNIHRMQQVFDVAAEQGRRVAIAGRRMDQTIEICLRLGYIKMPRDIRIRLEDISKFDAKEIVILITGSQAETTSALVQMSKAEYGRLKVQHGDTILYSARPIPGNEGPIWRMINRLYKLGANVVYEHDAGIHASGHGYQEEIKMMLNLTRPFYVAPVHGEPRHQKHYFAIAKALGHPEHRMFTMEAGVPLVIDEERAYLSDAVAHGRMLVDRAGNVGISAAVMRDRNLIAAEGAVYVAIPLNLKAGTMKGLPVISAVGYSGPQRDIDALPDIVNDALQNLDVAERKDATIVEHAAGDVVRKYLQRSAQLRPVVLPVIID